MAEPEKPCDHDSSIMKPSSTLVFTGKIDDSNGKLIFKCMNCGHEKRMYLGA